MRILPIILAPLALLAAAPLVAAAPARPVARPAAAADWSTRIAATAQGGLLIGNPNAPVKIVEFGSLTCPHCRHFHETGLPALRAKGLSAGRISYEYRSFSLNGIDLMAGLLLQCQAAPKAWALVNRIYARQDELVQPFMAITDADREAIGKLPADQQGQRMAELGKLPAFAAVAGIARPQYEACIAAKPGMDRLMAIRADAVQTHGLTGTPSFLINGKMQADVYDWAALEPALTAALNAVPSAPQRTK